MSLQEYWMLYDLATGDYKGKAGGMPGSAAVQQPGAGIGVIEMPYDAWLVAPEDLGPLKLAIIDQVNIQAGKFRALHITDIPGQQATYLEKFKDSQDWIAAGKPADLTPFPYLKYEAEQTGAAPEAVATEIITTAGIWRQADARIEGKRRGTSVAVQAATNIKDMVAAAVFNWADLIADLVPAA